MSDIEVELIKISEDGLYFLGFSCELIGDVSLVVATSLGVPQKKYYSFCTQNYFDIVS